MFIFFLIRYLYSYYIYIPILKIDTIDFFFKPAMIREQVITNSTANASVKTKLLTITHTLKLFQDYWFIRNGKVTVNRLMEFDIAFSNAIETLCHRKNNKIIETEVGTGSFKSKVHVKQDDPRISAMVGFFIALERYDDAWIKKTFRIPVLKDKKRKEQDGEKGEEEEEEERSKYTSGQVEIIRAWSWLRDNFPPDKFDKEFPELMQAYRKIDTSSLISL